MDRIPAYMCLHLHLFIVVGFGPGGSRRVMCDIGWADIGWPWLNAHGSKYPNVDGPLVNAKIGGKRMFIPQNMIH
jgi:hypothetical protein